MLESRDNQLKPMRQGLQCVYDSLMLKCRRFWSIRNVASRYQWQPGGPHIDRGGGGSTA